VSSPKNKKEAPAGDAAVGQRPTRKKEKMIRLDDLIPKKSVLGGRMLFGASEPNTNNPNTTKES
jgi:hypothetical protein